MEQAPPGVDAWKEETTAWDRIRAVAETISDPRSASEIAAEAHVATTTARDHLERLAEMKVLQRTDRDTTAAYAPDPLYTRMRALRELLDDYTRDELREHRSTIRDQLDTWQSEYGVESSDGVRERATSAETAEETRELRQVAADWELLAYRLSILDEALEQADS